jgi:hypothetical protein
MLGFIIGLVTGLAIPYAGPWMWGKWVSHGWPWVRSKLPAWLGGKA